MGGQGYLVAAELPEEHRAERRLEPKRADHRQTTERLIVEREERSAARAVKLLEPPHRASVGAHGAARSEPKHGEREQCERRGRGDIEEPTGGGERRDEGGSERARQQLLEGLHVEREEVDERGERVGGVEESERSAQHAPEQQRVQPAVGEPEPLREEPRVGAGEGDRAQHEQEGECRPPAPPRSNRPLHPFPAAAEFIVATLSELVLEGGGGGSWRMTSAKKWGATSATSWGATNGKNGSATHAKNGV